MKTENLTREELLKLHRRNKFKIIMDVILIIVLTIIFLYIFFNMQLVKTMNQDWCALCELKTGAQCIIQKVNVQLG